MFEHSEYLSKSRCETTFVCGPAAKKKKNRKQKKNKGFDEKYACGLIFMGQLTCSLGNFGGILMKLSSVYVLIFNRRYKSACRGYGKIENMNYLLVRRLGNL